jgi:hypothetical protein
MAKKSTTDKAKEQFAGAAKTGADAVRDIAGEAIRAAAVAAAGIALQRTAEALRGGARKAESAAPKTPQVVLGPLQGKPAKRPKTKKRVKAKKAAARSAGKKSAKKAKKRRTARRRSAR